MYTHIDQSQCPSTFELGSKVEHSPTPPLLPPKTVRDEAQDQMLLMKSSDSFGDPSESDSKNFHLSDVSLMNFKIVLPKTPSHSGQQTKTSTFIEESLCSLPPPRPPKPPR